MYTYFDYHINRLRHGLNLFFLEISFKQSIVSIFLSCIFFQIKALSNRSCYKSFYIILYNNHTKTISNRYSKHQSNKILLFEKSSNHKQANSCVDRIINRIFQIVSSVASQIIPFVIRWQPDVRVPKSFTNFIENFHFIM